MQRGERDMKIRIFDDSIRLRLDRDEVDAIARSEAVECHTHFPGGGVFAYRLSVADVDVASAQFVGSCIEVALPTGVAGDWASDDAQVSIRAQQPIADGDLTLLVEKDFECLDPREGEDQTNRFRNPKALA
jgi:hypothetical protein